MRFTALAELCERVASTTKRLEKILYLSTFLQKLGEDEIAPAVLIITGQIFPESSEKTLDASWKTIQRSLHSNQRSLLTRELSIGDVHAYFRKIAAVSQRKKKERILSGLLNQASQLERTYILKTIFGEMRIGASEGVMLEAIAAASGLPKEEVKRAHALIGDLGKTAFKAVIKRSLPTDITLFRPFKPMLAQTGSFDDITEKKALEYKLDGARIQIHTTRGRTKIFSRRLSDVTASLPDIVDSVRDFPPSVTEGEVVAVKDGKPLPFQELLRRFRRVHDIATLVNEIPVQLYLFDLLVLDGETLLEKSYTERTHRLGTFASSFMVRRIITDTNKKAEKFLNRAITAGHEGIMVKDLESPYIPGKRDKSWLKIKQTETLDLLVVAAEWGHGRRKEWLSNYHLAARGGEIIGKTFKGLTDSQFTELTAKLLSLKEREDAHIVYVRQEIVVEVAFNEIQKSPQYEPGYALRFARIKHIRYDKSPEDADTLDKVTELYERQFRYKGRREV